MIDHDVRFLIGGLPFSTRAAYMLSVVEEDKDTHATTIWSSKVPNRVKILHGCCSETGLTPRLTFVTNISQVMPYVHNVDIPPRALYISSSYVRMQIGFGSA